MLPSILRIITALSFTVWAFGCAGPPEEMMSMVDQLGWAPDDPAVITIDNTDTTTLRTLNIVMSYNNDFDREPVSVQVTVTSPEGKYYTEQFSIYETVSRKKSRDHHESVMPYRQSVIFKLTGQYTFTFSPLAEVKGIRAIGIKTE